MSPERVVIAKRTKYSPDGSGALYSRADLTDLVKYCESATHPRHAGVEITQYSSETIEEFVGSAERGLGAYLAAPRRGPGAKVGQRKKGRPAQIEIGEHDVFSLPPDADLTPAERQQIAEGIAQSSAYQGYPAMVFGHFMRQPSPGLPPWDLHIIAANFDLHGHYRVGRIKRRDRDYAAAIARAADDVVAKVNAARAATGRAPIKGIRERRDEKRRNEGRPSIEQLIADRIAPLSPVTPAAVVAALRALSTDGWTVEIDGAQKRATFTPPSPGWGLELTVNTRRKGRRQPRRRTYLRAILPACWEAGANGFLWWSLRDFAADGHPYNKNAFEGPLGLVGDDDRVKPVLSFFEKFAQTLPERPRPVIDQGDIALYWPRHYYLRDDPLNPGNDPRALSRRLVIAHFALSQLGHRVGIVRGDRPRDGISAKTIVIAGAALTSEEVSALIPWVKAGGRLVWHGIDVTTWGEALNELVGASPADLCAPRALGVHAFGATWDFRDFPRHIFLNVIPGDARVIARDRSRRPVLLAHALGRGSVAACLAQPDDTFAAQSDDRSVRARWLRWYHGMLALGGVKGNLRA